MSALHIFVWIVWQSGRQGWTVLAEIVELLLTYACKIVTMAHIYPPALIKKVKVEELHKQYREKQERIVMTGYKQVQGQVYPWRALHGTEEWEEEHESPISCICYKYKNLIYLERQAQLTYITLNYKVQYGIWPNLH